MEVNINLNDLICPTFVDVSLDIINCQVDKAVLKGGRNSTKSQVASECIIAGCMIYKQSAVCIVKRANKIKDRFIDTFQASLIYMGLTKFWKLKINNNELVLLDDHKKETNVSIKFVGCDDPENLKSFKARGGTVFRYIWFEEVTNFRSYKEVDNLIQTMGRGEGDHCVIFTYNPPIRSSAWVNEAFESPTGKILGHTSNYYYSEFEQEVKGLTVKSKQVIHHSTYLDVIDAGHAEWLGLARIADYEKAKLENNKFYRWAYLGEVTGTDANVFNNIIDWDGNESKLNIREILRGFDWGYGGPDPCAYVEWFYDRRNNCMYALNEFYQVKMDIPDVLDGVKKFNKFNFPVYADSANPLLNKQLTNKGLNIVPAKKFNDSVRAGIKWFQGLNGIYINKFRTPWIYKEFKGYEYVLDKDDNITPELPDANNHTIDASRYGASPIMRFD